MTSTGLPRELPPNPNITQLEKQAEGLREDVAALDPAAVDRVRASHPSHSAGAELDPAGFTLQDARATIAREYGFEGWHQLSTHVGEQMVEERDLHRWFGVQLNNQMWEAIEDDGIGPHTPARERERLLYSAYASAYHWRNVGNEAHLARGEHLISRIAARLGEADVALRHARRCVELVETHLDVMEDWDLAFGYEALARAHAAGGDLDAARDCFDRATALAAAVADEDDRAIVDGELARGPWFGLA